MLLALSMRNNLISALFLSGELDQGKQQWHYDNLIQEIPLCVTMKCFFNYFRMVPSMFDELPRLVGPSRVKKTTN